MFYEKIIRYLILFSTTFTGKWKDLQILFLLWGIILISSCRKEKIDHGSEFPLYTIHDTISGTMFANCDHVPDSNQKITVLVEGEADDYGFNVMTASVYTDSKGHFSCPLNYSVRSSSEPSHSIIFHDSCSIYRWPLHSEPFFVTNDTVHIKMNMQVSNPLTSNDTLYFRLNTGMFSFMTGPFTSGIINCDFPAWRFRFFKSLDTTKNGFTWAIGAKNLPYYYNVNAVNERVDIKHVSCSLSDTVPILVK
jgi:hypothetical protein